ncbi:hypothetical protein JTE90_014348 [Oedothorax gibbosus]|uniref:Uncharacterized protein n=1 Tax=Oedothorax gibbosus TaxID=931172 RepID=A0AAV6TI21_9ARAC|nr:hypothetical protein JTE90_014348 [Oedothorax gibbosus]
MVTRCPKGAQRGQKPRVEQKGKSSLDLDFQYEYGLRKQGLSILLTLRVLCKRCQKSYHRDNWLVAGQAFIATLLFDPSMSALPIIAKQNSPSVGLFTHL